MAHPKTEWRLTLIGQVAQIDPDYSVIFEEQKNDEKNGQQRHLQAID